jgi:outer membrane protein assembly factor BamB
VYAGAADKSLPAVARATGERKWAYATLGGVATPVVASDGTIYFGSDDAHVYALSPSGTLIWAVNAKGRVRGAPALASGTLIVTTDTSVVAIGP